MPYGLPSLLRTSDDKEKAVWMLHDAGAHVDDSFELRGDGPTLGRSTSP